eukprot:TRINITY_DN217_c0_g2_i1.p1 TRINITY_DN217_c0_g2~~TRINITY_DN217_c0_g2_i1.p1  ORF type:complete len:207 (+),score=42.11 TRINITY_DN217_c0_g2_i1:77-697(+)
MGDSILNYNGGSVVAMVGKNCVAIASDLRFGIRHQTISTDNTKCFKVTDKCFIGLPGLQSDSQTLLQKLKFRINLYHLREEREMKPEVFSNLVSTVLYEKRFGPFFVEPVVAGLGEDNEPFISAMDLIGAPVFAKDFVLSGTATDALYGMCESLFKPDLEPEELFEVISQCLLSACNRDALGGWGAVVHVITPDKIISRKLKGRQD